MRLQIPLRDLLSGYMQCVLFFPENLLFFAGSVNLCIMKSFHSFQMFCHGSCGFLFRHHFIYGRAGCRQIAGRNDIHQQTFLSIIDCGHEVLGAVFLKLQEIIIFRDMKKVRFRNQIIIISNGHAVFPVSQLKNILHMPVLPLQAENLPNLFSQRGSVRFINLISLSDPVKKYFQFVFFVRFQSVKAGDNIEESLFQHF